MEECLGWERKFPQLPLTRHSSTSGRSGNLLLGKKKILVQEIAKDPAFTRKFCGLFSPPRFRPSWPIFADCVHYEKRSPGGCFSSLSDGIVLIFCLLGGWNWNARKHRKWERRERTWPIETSTVQQFFLMPLFSISYRKPLYFLTGAVHSVGVCTLFPYTGHRSHVSSASRSLLSCRILISLGDFGYRR